MAYSRKKTRRPARRSVSRRTASRRGTARRKTSRVGAGQTLRIVVEQRQPASLQDVAQEMMRPVSPRRAKF